MTEKRIFDGERNGRRGSGEGISRQQSTEVDERILIRVKRNGEEKNEEDRGSDVTEEKQLTQ